METAEKQPQSLLAQLVDEEMKRPPTARELKKFENFDGLPPHRRLLTNAAGHRIATYPTLSVTKLFEIKAILIYALVRIYEFEIEDVKALFRAEDVGTVEKFLTVGDEIGPKSELAMRIQEAVRNTAEAVVDAAPAAVNDEKQRVAMLVAPKHLKMRKLKQPEIKLVKNIIVFLLMRRFDINRFDVRAILNYPTGEQIRSMWRLGERLLQLEGYPRGDRERVLAAARVFIAKR
ncbi:MAG: hypothetical protein JWM68_619 [Verrucomicrobiales bacterium]|nr:hypothetical protein [Verrucomicrobiales bacterium]